jgi:hypothetical protein
MKNKMSFDIDFLQKIFFFKVFFSIRTKKNIRFLQTHVQKLQLVSMGADQCHMCADTIVYHNIYCLIYIHRYLINY